MRSRSPPQHRGGGPIPLRLRLGHWRRRGRYIWRRRRARSAHRPPAAASCGSAGEVAAVAGEAVVFAGGREEGWLRAPEEECYVGRRAPRPLPRRTADGRGRGRRARRAPGRGARGGVPGASPPHRRPWGPGPPRAGRGMGACRDAPFVPRGVGRSGGQGALSSLGRDGDGGVPSPGAPSPGSPAAATAGPSPPPPPAPAARLPFLLAPGRRRLAEPRARGSESAPSWGPPGPARDPAGGGPGPGAPSFSFGCRGGRQAGDGGKAGGAGGGVGLQAVSHGPLPAQCAPCPPSQGWHPRRARSRLGLGKGRPPREPREGRRDPGPAGSPKQGGGREAPRPTLGPPPALPHQPGLRPAGQPPGSRGELGAWGRRGAHPDRRGCLRRWANQGPRMEPGPGPATCRPLGPSGPGSFPLSERAGSWRW